MWPFVRNRPKFKLLFTVNSPFSSFRLKSTVSFKSHSPLCIFERLYIVCCMWHVSTQVYNVNEEKGRIFVLNIFNFILFLSQSYHMTSGIQLYGLPLWFFYGVFFVLYQLWFVLETSSTHFFSIWDAHTGSKLFYWGLFSGVTLILI